MVHRSIIFILLVQMTLSSASNSVRQM